MKNKTFFLHGYESSGKGTKGKFFSRNFPYIRCPDFQGTLQNRLNQLQTLCTNQPQLTFIGSSYGGLMATRYSLTWPKRVQRLILMAPALNFEKFQPPRQPLTIPTLLIIGQKDTITPPDIVLPLADSTFSSLEIRLVDDDHMLHDTFKQIDWQSILQYSSPQ